MELAHGIQEVPLASGWSVIRQLLELMLEIGGMHFVSKLLMGSVVGTVAFWKIF